MNKIFVKIYNGKLREIFDIDAEKKKKVILTPVKDNQQEALIELFYNNKKIKTYSIKRLPPAHARVLNITLVLEMISYNVIRVKSHDFDHHKTEEDIKLPISKSVNKKLIGTIIIIPLGILFLSLLIYAGYKSGIFSGRTEQYVTITKEDQTTTDIDTKKITIQKTPVIKEKTPEPKQEPTIPEVEPTVVIKETIVKNVPIYDLASLTTIINQNTPLYFEKNTTKLREGEILKINTLAVYMKNYSRITLEIIGHTQSIGKPKNEQKLSIKRAELIKKLLQKQLPKKIITIQYKGLGATKQIIPNAEDDEDKKYNRRVEITVIKAVGLK